MFNRMLVPALLVLAFAGPAAFAHEKEVEGGEEGGALAQPQAVCDGGSADTFPCWNVDLLAWLPTGVFGQGLANDVWGWTDPSSGRALRQGCQRVGE